MGDNPLTASGYVPPEYNPAKTVLDTHSSTTWRFTNKFAVPGGDSNWEDYWYGLIIFPCVMVGVLLLFTFYLCCAPCCRCKCRYQERNRKVGFGLFILLCIGSAICWIYAFTIESDLRGSANGVMTTVDELKGLALRTENVLNASETVLQSAVDFLDSFGNFSGYDPISLQNPAIWQNLTSCPPGVGATIQQTGVRASLESSLQSINSAQVALDDVQSALNEFTGGEDASEVQTAIVIVFNTLMLLLTLLFLLTTIVNYLDVGGRHCAGLKRCMSKSFYVVTLTIGMLLIMLTVLISAAIQATSVVGSDICTPSIDQSLQHLVSEILELNFELATDESYNVPVCTPISGNVPVDFFTSAENQLPLTLCFYQKCRGDFAAVDFINQAVAASTRIGGGITDAIRQLASQNITNATTCEEILLSANTTLLDDIDNVMNATIALLECGSINPVYSSLFHDTLCNSYVAVSVKTWRTYFAGSLLMVIALAVYGTFHLGDKYDHFYEKYSPAKHSVPFSSASGAPNSYDSSQPTGVDIAGTHSLPTATEVQEYEPPVAKAKSSSATEQTSLAQL